MANSAPLFVIMVAILLYSQEIPGSPDLVCPSLSAAMSAIQSPPLDAKIESVFIFGGERVFKVCMSLCIC